MSAPSRFRNLWLTPLVLALLTAGGLVFALVADGVWDAFSWVALAVPILFAAGLFIRKSNP